MIGLVKSTWYGLVLARCYFRNNVLIYVLRWVPATGKRQTGCVEIWNDCKLGYLKHECATNFDK